MPSSLQPIKTSIYMYDRSGTPHLIDFALHPPMPPNACALRISDNIDPDAWLTDMNQVRKLDDEIADLYFTKSAAVQLGYYDEEE